MLILAKNDKSFLDMATWILLLVGGLNWGLVGFLNFDLVAALFGAGSMLGNIVYDLVGLSAVYLCFKHFMK